MMEKTYTPEQMVNSVRLMDVIANVPVDRQPEIVRLVEAMILGAELAAPDTVSA